MIKYIPCEQMKKLREAAKNGDEMARKILMAQLNDEDFSKDLETYFKPKEEPKPIEEVAEQPAMKQEETQQVQNVVEQQREMPAITGKIPQNDISDGILNVIGACDRKTLDIAKDPNLSDATKKGALSTISEIKQSCLDSLEKFGKLMSSITPKQEEEIVE